MKRRKNVVLFILLFVVIFGSASAQVTVGSSVQPNTGALLDIKEHADIAGITAYKGLGMPRVNLIKIDQLFPMFGNPNNQTEGYDTNKTSIDLEHIGLLVYNMTDSLPESLCPGIHVWDGSIWIRIPEPCKGIDPELLNSPNCYIVNVNGTSENIPVGKPYIVWKDTPELGGIELSGAVTVDLIWQDTPSLIDKVELVDGDKGPYSEFKVTAKSNGKVGNALVGVYVGGTLRWSWHIWVTDYDPNNKVNGTTYAHNNGEANYVFMDRNLGALTTTTTDANSMGLTYQWGRKDPFTPNTTFGTSPSFRPLYDKNDAILTEQDELQNGGVSGNGIKHTEITTATSNYLQNSIFNPTEYYYAKRDDSDTSWDKTDWYTSDESGAGSNNDLWGGVGGTKSPFDPCPKGWKVPKYSATLSPWAKYYDPWGWGGSTDITWGTNGMTLKTTSGNSEGLGFYPYGFFRHPRAVNECTVVGCTGQDYAGGIFTASGFVNNMRGMYWTATANTNNLSAKVININLGFNPEPELQLTNFAKSGGAFVRCVAE